MHIVSDVTDQDGRLSGFPAFREFTAAIVERCDEPPVVTRLEKIGSFRAFIGD